jgi:hypothetical protein
MSSPAKLTFFHQKQNFFPKIFGGSKYSPYLCHRLQDDSKLSGKATVIAYGFSAAGFFMPIKYHFPGSGKKVFSIWRLHEP